MGSVRPESHLLLLPGFVLLLFLHGLWYFFEDEPVRLSKVPLLFLPFLFFAVFSAWNISPMAWRGWQDLIYLFEAYIFFWVFCNNVRMISHLWVFCLAVLVPFACGVLICFYQLFQNPEIVANALLSNPVLLSSEIVGRSTGIFADPYSFAFLLLLLTPCFLFSGLVSRLPSLLRILCLYISLILFACLLLTQVVWVYFPMALLLFVLPWFVSQNFPRRILLGISLVLALISFVGITLAFSSYAREVLTTAWTIESEGIRRILWPEAFELSLEKPIFGSGSGAFPMLIEQSPRPALSRSALTPLNDALHLLVEYGLVGLLLLIAPMTYILVCAIRRLRKEPAVKFSARSRKRKVTPSRRFFISLALLGSFAFLLGALFNGALLLPALLLHGAFFFGILAKMSFQSELELPKHSLVRTTYFLSSVLLGLAFWNASIPVLKVREMELVCSQRLEEIVERRIHLSGNPVILNEIIKEYADACLLNTKSADLWIGRSQAVAQRFFANPSLFSQIGKESITYARKAVAISPDYARAWSQLGVALALVGDAESAEQALLKGIELAPNSSNAHYYWAAFAGSFEDKIETAKRSAKRAVELDPDNVAALRIYQKLSIL